ncbi:J domain-containing protein [Sphingomonas ginkgonis]|uniref:J domain-containing protein n=1 Tax=Sphingomonas ginkgonis TaxID=2315330 RepID=UPI001EEF8A42|nr:J domain-containing protein [Sphingomonas ginkgonis]
MKRPHFHGRVEGAAERCAVPGCEEPGEFKAPLTASSFNGPGQWRWLCLAHVREHNQTYNYFAGMSPEEIQEAQSPTAGWDRSTRVFAYGPGGDPGPAWGDFKDPLDAISARFRPAGPPPRRSRFSGEEMHALDVLGLDEESDLHAVRKRYSELVRRYHPDRNGGDRRHEKQLREVIDAWQRLRQARAFAA